MGSAAMTQPFVSRAGEKLQAALDAFELDVHGLVCADFGCNVGGFTDCLLTRGAAKVYAVDTGYGQLAWRLRKDPRVVVMERTNALYCPVPEPVDLAAIDVAWTPQALAIPAAVRWLKADFPKGTARIISLLKPHYEMAKLKTGPAQGVIEDGRARRLCLDVCRRLQEGRLCELYAVLQSPLRGKGGNLEFLLLAGRPQLG